MEKLVAKLALHYFVMILDANTIKVMLNHQEDLIKIDEMYGPVVEQYDMEQHNESLFVTYKLVNED